jgi:hypothetical protein
VSIQAVGWALEQDLPARPKLVLVAIANHADHTDGYCWLKAETIAREAACKKRSIYNFIGALVRNGYIRRAQKKADDGKQRANDYWLLFGRKQEPWVSGPLVEATEADDAPEETEGVVDDPQNFVEPDACDDTRQPDTSKPVDKHVYASGPSESACTRKRIEEPSKTKPKESGGRESTAAALRHYREPPPQPLGEVRNNAKDIFVYENSRAYDAWAKLKAREQGITRWHLTTRKLVDGVWRSGWYFPTLFPPPLPAIARSPPSGVNEEAAREFGQYEYGQK